MRSMPVERVDFAPQKEKEGLEPFPQLNDMGARFADKSSTTCSKVGRLSLSALRHPSYSFTRRVPRSFSISGILGGRLPSITRRLAWPLSSPAQGCSPAKSCDAAPSRRCVYIHEVHAKRRGRGRVSAGGRLSAGSAKQVLDRSSEPPRNVEHALSPEAAAAAAGTQRTRRQAITIIIVGSKASAFAAVGDRDGCTQSSRPNVESWCAARETAHRQHTKIYHTGGLRPGRMQAESCR